MEDFDDAGGMSTLLRQGIEAGPIALIRDGDRIRIDINSRSIELLVGDEELAERKKTWIPPEPKAKSGWLAQYAALVGPVYRGARLP